MKNLHSPVVTTIPTMMPGDAVAAALALGQGGPKGRSANGAWLSVLIHELHVDHQPGNSMGIHGNGKILFFLWKICFFLKIWGDMEEHLGDSGMRIVLFL